VSIPSVEFSSGAPATLKLGAPTQTSSIFLGFATGDVIDLAGIKATSLSYSQGTLTLFDANKSVVDTLNMDGSYTDNSFELQAHGNGTDLIDVSASALPDFLPQEIASAGPLREAFGSGWGQFSPFDDPMGAVPNDWHAVLQ